MNIKIITTSDSEYNNKIMLEDIVRESLNTHPFLGFIDIAPKDLVIYLDVSKMNQFTINHDNYINGNIKINIDGLDIFKLEQIERKDWLKKILTHELGHLFDARLTSKFGYTEDKLEGILNLYVNHLWNCYIDGRLGDMAPHSLEERKIKVRIA